MSLELAFGVTASVAGCLGGILVHLLFSRQEALTRRLDAFERQVSELFVHRDEFVLWHGEITETLRRIDAKMDRMAAQFLERGHE